MAFPLYPNIVVVPPCQTFGDTLTTVPLLFFLLEYYERVHFFLDDPILFRYHTHFFEKHAFFGTRILLMANAAAIQAGEYDEYHICNLHTGDWKHSPNNYLLSNIPTVVKEHYFCDRRPLYDFHVIDPKYLCAPNISLPLQNTEINSVVYYKMIGLNGQVRLDYFDYVRNREKEEEIKQEVLRKAGIASGTNYAVICSSRIQPAKIAQYVNLPIIDLHCLVEFPGWLFSLIEGSTEIHLVEGCNTNLIYFAQHAGILNIAHLPVYYHIWARERKSDLYKLDWYWKMVEPRHPNWVFETVEPNEKYASAK